MNNFYSKILKVVFTTALFNLAFSQYSNGYIVANEGNFGTPNAEVSYINENNVVTNNIYAAANGGAELGDVLQSIYFDGNRAFLVVNNSDKITVVNRTTFVKIADITEGIKQARYSTVLNGKLYSTNSEVFGSTPSVTVHDATTFALIKNIPLSGSGEEILALNGKIYVMKSFFSDGNSIEVIDPSTDTIVKTIVLDNGLQSIKINGNDIIAVCSNDTNGATVYNISSTTDTVVKEVTNSTIVVGFFGVKVAIDGTKIYLALGPNVYAVPTDLSTFSSTPFITVPDSQGFDEFYGLSAIDGKIFQGYANGFTGPSSVNEYNNSGVFQNSYTTTMGVNAVYKNVYVDPSLATTNNALSKVSLYPNPVSEILFLKNVENASYKIFDIAGKLVKSGKYAAGIQVSTLTKGIYIIQITTIDQQISEKFIVK